MLKELGEESVLISYQVLRVVAVHRTKSKFLIKGLFLKVATTESSEGAQEKRQLLEELPGLTP